MARKYGKFHDLIFPNPSNCTTIIQFRDTLPQILHPFGPKCILIHPNVCNVWTEWSCWVPHHYLHPFKTLFSFMGIKLLCSPIGTCLDRQKRSQTHSRVVEWLLDETTDIPWPRTLLGAILIISMFLKCFSSWFTLLTLKMIVVLLLHIHSPWSVVYMYPSLISTPHRLFPIHSSFQTVPYKYQTITCILFSSIIICLPPSTCLCSRKKRAFVHNHKSKKTTALQICKSNNTYHYPFTNC